ncbi:MAG: PQQ-binding-like beta-propeller repeat protein [Steroidobacteraceae bacterium]
MGGWHRLLKFAATLVISVTAVACGGGSGGSAATAPFTPLAVGPVHLSASTTDRSATTLTYTVTLDPSLDPLKTWILIRDIGGALDPEPSASGGSDHSVILIFSTKLTLAIGTHTGSLEFYACREASCATFISNIPAVANYEIVVKEAPPIATLDPAQVNVSAEQGDIINLPMTLNVVPQRTAALFLVVDDQGVFASDVGITAINGQQITMGLHVTGTLAPGTYNGTAKLLVCSFGPCSLDTVQPGGIISLPYSVTITPYVIPAPVATRSGLPEWETYQGNASHTGYVPVTLDPANFVVHWSWSVPGAASTTSGATTGSDRLAFSARLTTGDSTLFVLNEQDGSLAWSHEFGNLAMIDDPGISSNRVFVGATDRNEQTRMSGFDLADGTQRFETPIEAQWEHYLAPVVKDGYVYTNGGMYGGLYALKQTSGALHWVGTLEQGNGWSPAVDDQHAYAYVASFFHVIDLKTGLGVVSIPNPAYNFGGYDLNMAPVIAAAGQVLVVDGVFQLAHANHLISYDILAQKEGWRADGQFLSNPAVAQDLIHVLNADGNALQARDRASGSVVWQWSPADPAEVIPVGNLVLTDNLVFLSSTSHTYAVDRTTHQAVWSIAAAGALSLSSNAVLYIVSSQGSVTAVSLR